MTVPQKRNGRAKGFFPKVALARQALADRAVEVYEAYMALARDAQAAQEFAVAETILWKLLTHMPEDEESGTLLNTAIDNNRDPDLKGSGGPTIQIGLALGGMPSKALPEVTVTTIQAQDGSTMADDVVPEDQS